MATENFTIKKRKGSSGTLVKNTFERDKHQFLGWSTDPDATTPQYSDEQKITFIQDIDLYAIWKRYFDIIFDVSSATTQIAPENQTVADGLTYTVPVCNSVKTGHYFVKWDLNGEEYKNPAEVFTPTDDCLFTPVWRTNKTIKYNLNGGSGAIPANQTINSTSGITIASCSATKTESVFLGWNTDKDATTQTYTAGQNLKDTFDVDVIDLYAIWKTQYTVLFVTGDASYGTWTYTMTPETEITVPGNTVLHEPQKTGYKFKGWSEYQTLEEQDEHEILEADAKITPTGSKTYYSYFVPKYTVTYNLNGMTGTAPTEQVVVRGDSITLAQNNYTKEHTTANGWYVQNSDNSITYYSDNDTVVVTENMVVCANYTWYKKITFDINGGTGTTPSVIWTQNGQFTFPTCSATRNKYNFIGWSTSSSATEADNVAGDTKKVTSDKTYYAVWESTKTEMPTQCTITTFDVMEVDEERSAEKVIANNVYIPNGATISFNYSLKHHGYAADRIRFCFKFNNTNIAQTDTTALSNQGTTSGSVTAKYNGTTATGPVSLYLYELDTGCVGATLTLTNIKITY